MAAWQDILIIVWFSGNKEQAKICCLVFIWWCHCSSVDYLEHIKGTLVMLIWTTILMNLRFDSIAVIDKRVDGLKCP